MRIYFSLCLTILKNLEDVDDSHKLYTFKESITLNRLIRHQAFRAQIREIIHLILLRIKNGVRKNSGTKNNKKC